MKVVIFGAGRNFKKLLKKGYLSDLDIVAITDNDYSNQSKLIDCLPNADFIKPNDITNRSFDKVLITVLLPKFRVSIVSQLLHLGISSEKILYALTNGDFEELPTVSEQAAFYAADDDLYMDTTMITSFDYKAGIQRLVNNLYKNIAALKPNTIPVRYIGEYISSRRYASRFNDETYDNTEYTIQLHAGSKILFPDSSWDWEDVLIIEAEKKHAEIYTVIYDLIPLLYDDVHPKQVRENYKKWIHAAMAYSEGLICISKTVADDIEKYYSECDFTRNKPLSVYYIHLGFDIPSANQSVRAEIKNFVRNNKTFLMVGTVEPRKNHKLALQAFMQILSVNNDSNVRLLILGKDGWQNEEFKEMYRLLSDELRKNILWIQDANDSEVSWSYQNCTALLYPSKVEGFGLPIVEAAYFNLPILCSDTPIFREITQGYAAYFSPDDVDAIKNAIMNWLGDDDYPQTKNIRLYNWKHTAQEVLSIVNGQAVPYKMLPSKT